MNLLDDSTPVDPTEFVYRRIPGSFFKPENEVPVLAIAFRPTDNDSTGLSVFRERFSTVDDVLLAADPETRDTYSIARLAVAAHLQLDVSVTADAMPPVPGHAIIPELSLAACKAHKKLCKERQDKLAKLASLGIVHTPANPVS